MMIAQPERRKRRRTKTTGRSIRLPESADRDVVRLADHGDRSVNSLYVHLILDALRQRGELTIDPRLHTDEDAAEVAAQPDGDATEDAGLPF
jgi:hypothetical protein